MKSSPKFNLLVSLPYITKGVLRQIERLPPANTRILIDSGAFTAWKAGKEITLKDYRREIDALPFAPWRYFTLVVIGDGDATRKNFDQLQKAGYQPVPIFTRGEDFSVLEYYYDHSDLLAVGGLVGTPKNQGYVKALMQHVGKRQIHWLGFTRIDFLRKYRPYCCDASTWETGARYGQLSLYLGQGQFKRLTRWRRHIQITPQVRRTLQRLGYAESALDAEKAWKGGRSTIRRLCASSAVAFMLDLEKNTGTRLFSAASTDLAVELMIDAYERQTGEPQ